MKQKDFLDRYPPGTRMLWRVSHLPDIEVEVAGEPYTSSDDVNQVECVAVYYFETRIRARRRVAAPTHQLHSLAL